MFLKRYVLTFCGATLALGCFAQKTIQVSSPNSKIQVQVAISDSVRWKMQKGGEVLVDDAVTGIAITGSPFVGYQEKVRKITRSVGNDIITMVVAVTDKQIRDRYNELDISFTSGNTLQFRAYDNGVAYRWLTTFKDSILVDNEVLDYHFPENNKVFWGSDKENKYFQSHYELMFKDTTLAAYSAQEFCGLPLYMSTSHGTKLLLSESDLLDYSNLFFFGTGTTAVKGGFPKVIRKSKLSGDRGTKILENENYIAKTTGSRSFPWRVLMVADADKDLLENNLIYQLASPNVLKNTGWIRPGRVAWDWWNDNNISGVDFKSGINNQTYKYYIDFAAKFGLEYIILDEGWSKTTWDLTHPKQDIDIPELVAYGKQKNVGIILWTLWNPMDAEMDHILDTYREWGVKGIKVDFMARADQYMVNFYERLARKAADRQLLVDLHGAYKPVGLNRKYPNILSYEGVKGLENYKWSDEEVNPPHDVTIPFTRMVLGAMDYTPGAMHNRSKKDFYVSYSAPMSEGTRAHQVAMYAVYTSPLQMFSDNPTNYLRDSVCTAYMASFPTTWDTTVALDGKIGEYVAAARKKGNKWYVGAMTNWVARELTISLDFLPVDKTYRMRIFADGINADKSPEDYTIQEKQIKKGDSVSVKMQPGGGWAAIISEE
ncbi:MULTISPECIES: glycoside hydrolase family 97 catalytic domain-containing protein [Chitinophagaceae]